MLRHVEMYLSGKLKPYTIWNEDSKSENRGLEGLELGRRERFDEGPNADIGKGRLVKVLSLADGTFNYFLHDREKDGLVLFHADDGSCVPCEQFSPYYSECSSALCSPHQSQPLPF